MTPTDLLAQAAAAVEGASPAPWMVSVDNDYFEDCEVYAYDGALEPPPYHHGLPDAAELSDAWGEWADEHVRGTVAHTTNDTSIPDDEHAANTRFIAAARSLLPAVAEALGRLLEICNGLDIQQTICELSHFSNDDEAEAAFELLYKNWADLRAFLAGTEGT